MFYSTTDHRFPFFKSKSYFSGVSIISVTGPSLISDTCIFFAKSPLQPWICLSREHLAKLITSGSAISGCPAPVKLGRLPFRQLPYSVKCETPLNFTPDIENRVFIFPSSIFKYSKTNHFIAHPLNLFYRVFWCNPTSSINPAVLQFLPHRHLSTPKHSNNVAITTHKLLSLTIVTTVLNTTRIQVDISTIHAIFLTHQQHVWRTNDPISLLAFSVLLVHQTHLRTLRQKS